MHRHTLDDDLNHIENLYARQRSRNSQPFVIWSTSTPKAEHHLNPSSPALHQPKPTVTTPSYTPRTR